MHMKTNLAVIGGFLGSGKTTSILNIAKHLAAQGKRVGIVTNDQGSNLVDTNFLIKSKLPVLEVTGGCFCCNFQEFTDKVSSLAHNLMPDIILAEPVGSCTDLIATIFKPIQREYTTQFSMSPLSIVADPHRVRKLMMEGGSIFPSEINYLFKKQLEEADIIVLNKIDTISVEHAKLLSSYLLESFKGSKVIEVSAKDGDGIKMWVSMILNRVFIEKPSLEIDYETYSLAEESLGWLNYSGVLKSNVPYDANGFIFDIMEGIKSQLKKGEFEIAHLKVYMISGQDFAKASLTGVFEETDFSKAMENPVDTASLIINGRVSIPPETLERIVLGVLDRVCQKYGISTCDEGLQCFKPSKPKPTCRLK